VTGIAMILPITIVIVALAVVIIGGGGDWGEM
jgi:hypothetical protein